MKPDTKYFISQIVALPTVAVPSVLGAIFFGGSLANLTGDRGPIGCGVICFSVGIVISKAFSLLTGLILEKLGLLPRFAWRYYPNATSWGGYLKKTGRL
jgi:hypothetical protein